MATKNVTLSIDDDVYDNYKKFCKSRGLLISKQVEIMMEEQMKNEVEK